MPNTDCNLLPIGALKSKMMNGLAAFRAASLLVEWTLHTLCPLWAEETALIVGLTGLADGSTSLTVVLAVFDGGLAAGVTWLTRAGLVFFGPLSCGRG